MLFYIFVYLFMNLGAFVVTVFVKNKMDVEDVDGWKGLGFKNPLIASSMVICLVSLSGLPPTSGFVAKFYVLAELPIVESFLQQQMAD